MKAKRPTSKPSGNAEEAYREFKDIEADYVFDPSVMNEDEDRGLWGGGGRQLLQLAAAAGTKAAVLGQRRAAKGTEGHCNTSFVVVLKISL